MRAGCEGDDEQVNDSGSVQSDTDVADHLCESDGHEDLSEAFRSRHSHGTNNRHTCHANDSVIRLWCWGTCCVPTCV